MRAALASLLFATACAGTATYSGTVTVGSPDLVEAEPGVQVVADYNEPIFYSDNYYWRNDGGRWYRSSSHDRGWVVAEPPQRVRGIKQPERYRHYRPANYKPRNNRPDQRKPDKDNNRPDHDRDKDNNRPDHKHGD